MSREYTEKDFNRITQSKNIQQASCVTGSINSLDSYGVKEEYIKHVFGPRATQGFFNRTRANVNKKFAKAWEAAQNR